MVILVFSEVDTIWEKFMMEIERCEERRAK